MKTKEKRVKGYSHLVTFKIDNGAKLLMKSYETKKMVGTVGEWNAFIQRVKGELGSQYIVIHQLTHSF